jgi:hypothetical protein
MLKAYRTKMSTIDFHDCEQSSAQILNKPVPILWSGNFSLPLASDRCVSPDGREDRETIWRFRAIQQQHHPPSLAEA